MSRKKFTIAPELATGIRNTIQSAASNHGQLHYDMMSLDLIELDPKNPRKLSISKEEILSGLSPSDSNYNTKLKELESLKELSESIKKIGLKNAIEVYKDGSRYRVITGERRYWATLLAAHKSIPVRISQRPDEFNLRYTQWVENINRQDLSLFEKFNNLIMIADAYEKTKGELSEQSLQDLLGVSKVQAYRYYCLLKADERIIQLINLGKINNLKIVQELVSMKDPFARDQIISWILASKNEVTSITKYKESAGRKNNSSKGRKHQTINLGSVNNSDVAKHLFEIVLSDVRLEKVRDEFINIDWTSARSIKKAFKDLFCAMERELLV